MANKANKTAEEHANAPTNIDEKEEEDLISMYTKLRKLKYENELVKVLNMHQINNNIVRVMSYNILADGPNYALGKWLDYCPFGKNGDRLSYRKWSYRGPRILSQIQCYKPDILCLQETTIDTFNKYFEPKLKAIGYHGIHGIRDIIAAKKGNINHMTDALFYNTQKFKLIDQQILRIDQIAKENKNDKYSKYFGDYSLKYPYLSKLMNRVDICIILHLEFIKTKKPLIALNSHLFWDDIYAHTKLAQCLLINVELYDIITNKWKLDANKVPIIFGTDANSNVFKSQFDIFYDPNHPVLSGVYQLMTTSKLNKQHIDHPFTRCKLVFDDNNHQVKNDNDKRFIVNLRGLPYSARDKEITEFFKDEKIKNINIISQYGKPSGSATVEFDNETSLITALKKHKQFIGNRYIEINPLTNTSSGTVETKSSDDKERFVVKMVGLPWSAREKQVREFFKDENVSEIVIIFFNDGRASGECLVEFADDKSLKSALLKNKEYIGKRYVEIFVSDGNEMDVATGRVKAVFVNPSVDDWVIDIEWKSAYKDACGYEPLLTCKSPEYWGVSDYIFISKNCKAISYLELPYHDDTLKRNEQNWKEFPNLPTKIDPSDHLPIVCDVEVSH